MVVELELLTTEEEWGPKQIALQTRRLQNLDEVKRSLRQVASVYLRSMELDPDLSDGSKVAYAGDLRQFLHAMDELELQTIGQVDVTDLDVWKQGMQGMASSTICRKLASVSVFFEWARKHRLVAWNPVDAVDRPTKKQRETPAVTRPDYERLNAACQNTTERALLGLMFWAGLRRTETTRLDVRCIDMEARTILIEDSKGGDDRVVPVCWQLYPLVEEVLLLANAPHDPLLINRKGGRLSPSVVNRWFGRWVKHAGVEARGYTPHSCRHGCASLFAAEGLATLAISQMLGHRDPKTSQRYVSSSPEILKRQIDQVEAFGIPPAEKVMDVDDLREELRQTREAMAEMMAELKRLREQASSGQS